MTKKSPVFTPEEILRDERFASRKDALAVVLTDGPYTLKEAENLLSAFMERGAE